MIYGNIIAIGHVDVRHLNQPGKIVIETPLAAPDSLIAIGAGAAAALRPIGVVSTSIVAIGEDALALATATSQRNIAIGRAALGAVVAGVTDMIAIGDGALALANVVGSLSIAVGSSALASQSTGNSNIAIGNHAAIALTTGSRNLTIGADVMNVVTTGTDNIVLGHQAMTGAAGGEAPIRNVVIGASALHSYNTAVTDNVIVGAFAAESVDNIQTSVLVGMRALNNAAAVAVSKTVIIGYNAASASGVATPTDSTIVGYQAALATTSAQRNVHIGSGSGSAVTTGGDNVLVGYNAAAALIGGALNVVTGATSAGALTTGTKNIVIGGRNTAGGAPSGPTTSALNVVIGVYDTTAAAALAEIPAGATGSYIVVAGGQTIAVADPALRNIHFGARKPGNWRTTTGVDNQTLGDGAAPALTTGSRNTALGTDAMNVVTTGTDNVALGYRAMFGAAGGEAPLRNVVIGESALGGYNTAVTDNVIVGAFAAEAVDNIQTSVLVGMRALNNATAVVLSKTVLIGYNVASTTATANPVDSVLIGYQASIATTSAVKNVAIGSGAGPAITSGGSNTLLGFGVAPTLTTGGGNVVIGVVAGVVTNVDVPASGVSNYIVIGGIDGVSNAGTNLVVSDPGLRNIHIGSRRPGNWLVGTGADNQVIGDLALAGRTTGAQNVAIGSSALGTVTTAARNVAIGHNALALAITGSARNVVIGSFTADALNTVTTDAVIIGDNAAGAATRIQDSVIIGSSAHLGTTANTARVVIIGTAADGSAGGAEPTDAVIIGYHAGFVTSTAAGLTAIGSSAALAVTTGPRNTLIGFGVAPTLTTGGGNVVIGVVSGATNVDVPAAASAQYIIIGAVDGASNANTNLVVSDPSLKNIHIGARRPGNWRVASGTDNQAYGDRTLDALTTGSRNLAFGSDAIGTLTTGTDNIGLGHNALLGAAGSEAALRNIAIGSFALDAINAAVVDSVALGYNAGTAVTSGPGGVYIGSGAGVAVTTGPFNTLVGFGVAPNLTTGRNNVVIGAFEDTAIYARTSAVDSTGQIVIAAEGDAEAGLSQSLIIVALQSVYIGSAKPGNWLTSSGTSNVGIGDAALAALTTGTLNVAVGTSAGSAVTIGTHNTLLGNNAGTALTTGLRNILIGSGVGLPAAGTNDFLNLGKVLFADLSGKDVRIGGLETAAVAQTERLAVTDTNADTVGLASFETTGANGSKIFFFFGTQNPNGVVTGAPGDIYFQKNGVNSKPWCNVDAVGGTTWTAFF